MARDNRWRCPLCGSNKVQISLPVWFVETKDYELRKKSVDTEADPLWWYCPACNESGSGSPEEAPK